MAVVGEPYECPSAADMVSIGISREAAMVAHHAAHFGGDAHGGVAQVLALQQVHLGIEVAIECALNGGGHCAVERGVLHVP